MAIEKKWAAVLSQAITSNGTSQGQIGVTNVGSFYVKQTVELFSNSVSISQYQIKRVNSAQSIELGRLGENINDRVDLSSFLVSDSAMIRADEQFRPAISVQDRDRAVYQEEPAVALRVMQVDSMGLPVSASGASGLAPGNFDHIHKVLDVDGDVSQYQFFLSGISVGNINVIYNSDKVATDYVKA